MSEITLGNLYDINKSAMIKEKPLDPILLNNKICQMAKWMKKRYDLGGCSDSYTMLLCRERFDFTIFNILGAEEFTSITNELLPTLKNRGDIISIDATKDDVGYEIWIKDEEEVFVYYLFPYSKRVIEINE